MKRTLITAMTVAIFSTPLAAQQQGGSGSMTPGQVFLMQMDADKDGKVTREEYLKPYEAQFAHMDSNKDGGVSQDEADAFAKQMRERMMQMQKQRQQ